MYIYIYRQNPYKLLHSDKLIRAFGTFPVRHVYIILLPSSFTGPWYYHSRVRLFGSTLHEKGLAQRISLVSSLCVFLVFISTSVPSVIAGVNGSMTIDTVIFWAMSFQTEWQVNIWFTRKSQVVSKIVSLPPYNIWRKWYPHLKIPLYFLTSSPSEFMRRRKCGVRRIVFPTYFCFRHFWRAGKAAWIPMRNSGC